jgi:type IV pilus assembly protein PilP
MSASVCSMIKTKYGLFKLIIVVLLVLWPLQAGTAQETGAPADDTLSQGLNVIKDAKDNKLVTPEERAAEATGEEAPSPEKSPAAVEGEGVPATPEAGRGDALLGRDEKPPYDSTGMRDPFKPFIKLADTPAAPSLVLRPPIQRYPLNQFRITGIVWIGGKPQAMVVDPEGNTYFLGVGDKIGSSDGEILEVRQDGILVEEKTRLENVYGEVKFEVKQSVLAFQNEE